MENAPLIAALFDISHLVRYIAIYNGQDLLMQQRPGIKNPSAGESDKYEELIVNPTLIKLATQRGNIDCGGLEYFVIRYGNFFVLLFPTADGHVNLGVELTADPFAIVNKVKTVLAEHHGYSKG